MGAGSRWSWGAVSGSGSETLVLILFVLVILEFITNSILLYFMNTTVIKQNI